MCIKIMNRQGEQKKCAYGNEVYDNKNFSKKEVAKKIQFSKEIIKELWQ